MLDSDQKVFFDLFFDESDGTQRLFSQAGGLEKFTGNCIRLFPICHSESVGCI